jgi:hypothetical protein
MQSQLSSSIRIWANESRKNPAEECYAGFNFAFRLSDFQLRLSITGNHGSLANYGGNLRADILQLIESDFRERSARPCRAAQD